MNQYPKVSHTFIRREILALEAMGVQVERFSLRGWDEPCVDPLDIRELDRTRFILQQGVARVLLFAMLEAVRRPYAFLRAMRMGLRMANRGDRTVFHHLFSVAEAAVLSRWLREAGVQHLHAHFGTNSAEIAMLASRLCRIPYSFTVHGADEWDSPRQLKIREKVEHAKFVVAISDFTRAQVLRWARVEDESKVHVVHCGLDDEYLRAPVAPLPPNVQLVCVGRLCAAKAQHLLVEAFARAKARGAQARLVLVGDGELRSVVETVVQRNGLQNSVLITGWASGEEVLRHIASSSVFVLPSLVEGLPVAIMEALAMGRPVLTTFVGGIPELIRPGIEGWLVPPSDIDALADAICAAASTDPQTLESMGLKGKERVGLRHRLSDEVAKLKALIDEKNVISLN